MQPAQMGQAEGSILIFLSSPLTVGEVAVRSIRASMSQDCSRRKGTRRASVFVE